MNALINRLTQILDIVVLQNNIYMISCVFCAMVSIFPVTIKYSKESLIFQTTIAWNDNVGILILFVWCCIKYWTISSFLKEAKMVHSISYNLDNILVEKPMHIA